MTTDREPDADRKARSPVAPDHRRSWARVTAVVLITLAAVLAARMVDVALDTRRAEKTERELAVEVEGLAHEVEALETGAAEAGSDQAVERWAREEMGWVREGDHAIAVMVTPESPMPNAAPEADEQSIVDRIARRLSDLLGLDD